MFTVESYAVVRRFIAIETVTAETPVSPSRDHRIAGAAAWNGDRPCLTFRNAGGARSWTG